MTGGCARCGLKGTKSRPMVQTTWVNGRKTLQSHQNQKIILATLVQNLKTTIDQLHLA